MPDELEAAARLPRPRPGAKSVKEATVAPSVDAAATLSADAAQVAAPLQASVAAVFTQPAGASDTAGSAIPAAAQGILAGPTPMPPAGPSEAIPFISVPSAPSGVDESIVQQQVLIGRLPRPRPAEAGLEAAERLEKQFFGFKPDLPLKAALDAVNEERFIEARQLAAEHGDPLVKTLIDWMVARNSKSDLTAREVIRLLESHAGWPEPERLNLRAEQAFHALAPDPEAVLTFYSLTPPRTVGGKLTFAAALRSGSRREEADALVRELWREGTLAANQSASLLARFGASLRREDHVYRFRRLVLDGATADAVAQAEFLGPDYARLARAVIAVLDRQAEGPRALRALAPKFFGDPLYVFAEIRRLRRADQPLEAARLILQTKPDAELAGNADAWWDERRDLSRSLLDRGTPDLAYRVAATGRPKGDAARTEAAFHAGWYALRFLDDPERAEPHFRALLSLATLARTRARASYWLGRTYEAKDEDAAARLAYGEAARFGGAFYGQLAREKLGFVTTGVERMPAPSALDRLRFAERDGVKAIRLLASAGYEERAFPFFRALAETIEAPGEIALLTGLARRIGQQNAGITAATIAEQRGLRVASLPAPFIGVPPRLKLPGEVDRALVYAVVRQESAFNAQATSHVGARGLMQLMPATAKATARNARLPFSVQRLTSDPHYNATLGAHYLDELLDRLDSSYVLTFVGYNAGPGRALQWIKSNGDPRGGAVDPVDWIERIPFDETRNYVQKVMENLQVYRSRIGYPLSLSEDLVRGGPQG
ncbi:MAG: transglycosylase SLT domain-containing protein [Rhizobiales bacterium]|nr:transglycosylase SLT domain-containing protein [Hyphomicrobiales bacterium]